MRKTILTVLGLLVTVIASAYTCVSFKSGDPSILLKKAKITYEIDWNHARVTNYDNLLWQDYLKKRGADFVADWPKDRKQAEKYFTVRFNQKSDYMQIVEGGSGDYKMIVRPETIDVGNGGSAFNPWASAKAGGVVMNGIIEFRDSRTNKLICVLNIINAKGAGTASETIRLGMTLNEIAGDICDFIEDDVEKGHVQATPVGPDSAPAASASAASGAAPAAATKSTTKSTGKTVAGKTAVADNGGNGTAQVTLKDGTVITGKVKSLDPAKGITIVVAGITTTIPMKDVKEVKEVADDGGGSNTAVAPAVEVVEQSASNPAPVGAALGSQKLMVTETKKYPASFTLNINGQQVTMILVPGGRMNMGYDGSGSRKMHSEPVHEVAVTSFYISEHPLPVSVVVPIVGDKNVDGKGNEPAQVREFVDAERVVAAISQQTGKHYRLPTEAEWEYAACSAQQNQIFRIASGDDVAYEWCSDWLDWYSSERIVVTDPTGPMSGEQHVVRAYNGERGKFDRSSDIDEDDAYVGLVRLAIKAKDYK